MAYQDRDAVIVGAVRTPVGKGKASGALHEVLSADLLAHIAETERRKGDLNSAIDDFRRCSQEAPNNTECLQMLGAAGYMKDHPMELYYRDARQLTIVEGTSEIQLGLIARGVLRGDVSWN